MINNNFKAIFNPFTRELAVLYGNKISTHIFEELCEWCKISFNGDKTHPSYLHVHLDYDECLQLIFYPREAGNESLNENLVKAWYTEDNINSEFEEISIVFNDRKFNKLLKEFVADSSGQIVV